MRDGSSEQRTGKATSTADFEWLLERLLRFTRRHCPPSLRGEAEDLAQTAVVKVLAINRGDGPDVGSSSYLWRTAYSVVVDELRRRSRRREVGLDEATSFQLRAVGADPEVAVAARGLETAVVECLRRLVEDRRRAVVLRLQGHSVEDVGRLLGWSAKRAENLVYRGLANLRRCLGGKGFEP